VYFYLLFFVKLFLKIKFILKLNRIDLLNIGGCSLSFVLFGFLFWSVALTAHTTSFDVIMSFFLVGFETSQQTLLVVDDVHGGVMVSVQQSFFSSPSRYDIVGSYILVNC
jgi:hypothetical protein